MQTDTEFSVGREIRAEMGRQRVSMARLSRQVQVPRSTLTEQIDSDRVSVSTLLRIATALRVPAARLLPEAEAQ